MKKYGLLIPLIILLTGFFLFSDSTDTKGDVQKNAEPVEEYDLDSLITLCFERNIDIETAAERVSGQLARASQAKAKALPGITFSVVYSHIGVVPRIEMPGFEDIKFIYPEMLNFTLSVDYNLFDWGMTKDGGHIETLSLQSRRMSGILMKKGFMMQLSLLYVNILQLEENEAVIAENIILINEIIELLKQQFTAGIIPEHQLLQARVSLQTLRGQQLELKKLKTEMKTTLKNVCGLPFDREIKLHKWQQPAGEKDAETAPLTTGSRGPEEGTFTPDKLAALLNEAAAVREDFKILNLQLRILEKTRSIISKSRLPLFSAGLNAELRNGIMPDVERLRTNWNVGLTMIYNLFDRNNARFEKEVLAHEIQAVQLSIKKLQREVRANLHKLMSNLKMLDEKREIEEERLRISRRSLALARESFKESRATYLEVLSARADYNMAESSLIAIKYRRYTDLFQVRFELYPLENILIRRENETE